jgi:hypothetical protein
MTAFAKLEDQVGVHIGAGLLVYIVAMQSPTFGVSSAMFTSTMQITTCVQSATVPSQITGGMPVFW